MAMAPERIGIGIRRHFTTPGVHPYDEVAWERRDARITNYRDGSVAFEQRDVEVPTFWSQNATNILAQKYFRGQLGTPERETSLKQVADRVADAIADWGEKDGYFIDAAEAAAFRDELKYLIVHQRAAFNSPVWFNIGVKGAKQQASACQPWHAPVSTPEGLVPIGKLVEDRAVGAKVYDSFGVAVILAVKANGVKTVLRVQTTAGPLEVTPDHLVWRSMGADAGMWVPAGELRPGDHLEWHCTEPFSNERAFGTDVAEVTIERIDDLGPQQVYDIQTDSGEYLSGNIRVHNCFILAVEDTMDAILDWYKEEGIIFKGGSGSGINLSRIRSSKEPLKGGGTASGPVSFMRGADASAGTIKSGGTTRRAAKMVILNADHPDIEDFIWCKAIEERKARALRDAGFDMDLDGKDSHSIQYQNANNSVRLTDEFMQAVIDDADWYLRAVTTGQVVQTVKARDVFRQIAKAAWECADPGLQFDTTINNWHTAANTGRINASNPCCFVGETEVLTTDGPVAIAELVDRCDSGDAPPGVRAFDTGASAHVTTPVNKAWVAGYTRSLVDVALTCGRALRCTPEHRFLTATGAWVQARDLEKGQRVRTTDGTRRVRCVEEVELAEEVAVYDLEAVDYHNFAVSLDDGAGVIVHNSEYVHLDNSACNLASINLLRFLRDDDSFDVEGYKAAIEVVFTAQEILVGNADYPTPKIDATTRRFRQLGLGYANLGALLMALGLPYDSDGGRAYAAALTALMTGHAYATSARTAMRMGPFAGYTENREHMNRVLRMHRAAVAEIDEELVPTELLSAAQESWDTAVELGEVHGVRNSQATVLAPTGTISFMMDCDTTGIEPDLGLVKTKKLVGGGTMSIVNQTVPRALQRLGYTPGEISDIVAYIDEHYSVVGAPHLRSEHLPVFACSMGDLTIHYRGHINMMAAAQPFLSGSISKTINMPESATVEDVEQMHMDAWKLGLKAVAIYRDNCKVAQPLSTTKKDGEGHSGPELHDEELAAKVAQLEAALQRQTVVVKQPMRERLPRRRKSNTFAFRVADCEGYVTVGEYDDGRPGEVFMKVSKQGSTLAGIMDAFSISVSLGLQHGVPLATYVRKYTNMRFEPAGMTDDPDLRIASSLVDYIFRRLAVDYLPYDERAELGILTTGERMQPTLPGIEEETTPSAGVVESPALPEPVRDQVVDVRLPGAPDAKDAP
ncbi:MAG TPA: polymorphic toxin-type HINT domain-containing protein, partial [Acidimicrobiales bacterium]|nr:polymorphic toxin-type HINT domain-containing protein [Acidimicrobiales bacterium]